MQICLVSPAAVQDPLCLMQRWVSLPILGGEASGTCEYPCKAKSKVCLDQHHVWQLLTVDARGRVEKEDTYMVMVCQNIRPACGDSQSSLSSSVNYPLASEPVQTCSTPCVLCHGIPQVNCVTLKAPHLSVLLVCLLLTSLHRIQL